MMKPKSRLTMEETLCDIAVRTLYGVQDTLVAFEL